MLLHFYSHDPKILLFTAPNQKNRAKTAWPAKKSKVLVTLLYLVAPPYGNNNPVVEVMFKALLLLFLFVESFDICWGGGWKDQCGYRGWQFKSVWK